MIKKKRNFDYVEQFPHILGTALPIAIIILVVGLFAPKVVKAVGVSTLFAKANVVIDSEVEAKSTSQLVKKMNPDSAVSKAVSFAAKSQDSTRLKSSSYVSPKDLAKMALGEILKKHKEETIDAILSDRSLWGRVLEELEIKTALEIGKEKYPEIKEKWGQMISDSMTSKLSGKFTDAISTPDLGVAFVSIESQGYPKAKSKKNAKGLWQLMTGSARELCVELGIKFPNDQRRIDELLYNPQFSTCLGTSHLLRSTIKQKGDVKRTIVAYWCGDGGVDTQIKKYGGIDNVPYLRKVWPMYCWILEQNNDKAPVQDAPLANN